jgi:Na+/H+-translocating membrane pyrophosphatase
VRYAGSSGKSRVLWKGLKPEYERAIDIVAKATLHEIAIPGFFAVFVLLLIGFFLGPKALTGLQIGLIVEKSKAYRVLQ